MHHLAGSRAVGRRAVRGRRDSPALRRQTVRARRYPPAGSPAASSATGARDQTAARTRRGNPAVGHGGIRLPELRRDPHESNRQAARQCRLRCHPECRRRSGADTRGHSRRGEARRPASAAIDCSGRQGNQADGCAPGGGRSDARATAVCRGGHAGEPWCPGRAIIAFVTDPSAGIVSHAKVLEELFSFPPAEARLVLALLYGTALPDYAPVRALLHTVRTLLARAMARTETRTQLELELLVARAVAGMSTRPLGRE
jgi:hypothetical protein